MENASKEMYTEEMQPDDVISAVCWLTERIRKKTGNTSLAFPADWMPVTGMVVKSENKLLAVATLYL